MASIAQPWLISKFVDPIFAVAVGMSAATLRIRREQREKFPDRDSSPLALWQRGFTMAGAFFSRLRTDEKKN